MADTVMKSSMGGVWLQKTPGQDLYFLGNCVDLDDITIPKSAQSLIQCRNNDGVYQTIGTLETAPDAVTTTIKRLLFKETDILDELTNCYITVYVMQHTCGRAGNFPGWSRGVILHHGKITEETLSGLAAREDAESSTSLPITSWNPAYKVQELTVRQQSIAETTDLRDIAFCNPLQCAGDCGEFKEKGTDGFIAGDAPAGSPSSKADIWWTEDKGADWENTTGGAAHPFGIGEDIVSNTCFAMDATTTRWLVAREASGADFAEVAYSDDGGATWTVVVVGSVAGEGAAEEGALFSLSLESIWFATDQGNIYFSSDGGANWVLEASSATASGGNSLNVVKFADADNGWAVGASDTVIRSTDGGTTWAAITSPTTTDNVTSLEVFDKQRALIGSNADGLFQTWDSGVNWTSHVFTGQSTNGTVKALDFANHLCGFMLHNPAVGQGYVHQTVNGGKSWQRLTTPANAGLNAQAVIDENTCFCVGNSYSGTGFVAKISR